MQQTSPPASPPATKDETTARQGPNLRLIVPLILLVVVGGLAWYFLSRPKSDALTVSGRIEGYETDVGAKTAGRVDVVTVREGDLVKKGQLLVRIDDSEIQAQLNGAKARIASARQQEEQARVQIRVVEGQVRQSELSLLQSRGDAQGRIAQADAQVATTRAQAAQSEAQVTEAQANLNLARLNRDRYVRLEREGVVAAQQLDQSQATFEAAQATLNARLAAVNAARKQVAAAQGSFTQTRTASINPDLRGSQLDVTREQLVQARSQRTAAQAEVRNAQATQQQLQAQIAYLNIVSPISGVVTARSVEPGAVVTSGKTLLSLIDLNRVYLRAYVPEGSIGRVRIGQKARVLLDSYPDRPFAGTVGMVDPQASFTPENIYFKEERVTQAFGVKILLDKPAGFAKPGMPADAEILSGEEGR